MRIFYGAVAVAVAVVAAGCAPAPNRETAAVAPSPSDAVEAAFFDRARQVHDAWQPSDKTIWTTGFAPAGELTIVQGGGFPDGSTKLAASGGWFTLATRLPTDTPAPGKVRFADGSTMDVPVIGARTAYDAINTRQGTCTADSHCRPLTVTAATLTTATVHTSRGEATVPVWSFTVREVPAGPIDRVAVDPAAISAPPKLTVAPLDQAGRLRSAVGVRPSAEDRLDVQIYIGCGANPRPMVWESADAVVVGGREDEPPAGVACALIARLTSMKVTLERPLGDRVVLDAVTGQPLRLPTGHPY